MRSSRVARLCLASALLIGALTATGAESGRVLADSSTAPQVIGRSVQNRPIDVVHLGPNSASTRIVVLGQMHGNEPAGKRVVSLLESGQLPADVQLWLIPTMNPDGSARGTRRNAHKVDLNRNFPSHWKASVKRSLYYSGPSLASEPETQALMKFLLEVRPTAVISFHQSFGMVDDPYPRGHAAARKLGQLIGLRTGIVPCRGVCNGTMTGWVNSALEAIGITVELHASVNAASAQRAATAVIGLGAWLAGTPVPTPPAPPKPRPTATASAVPAAVPTASPTTAPTSGPEPSTSPTGGVQVSPSPVTSPSPST